MKTRRKAQQLNQATEIADSDIDLSISQTSETNVLANSLHLEAPDDFNIDELQRFLPGLSLLAPTAETIAAVYRFALDQVIQLDLISQDRDQARAAVTRMEVELDQALQDQDVQSSQLRTSLEEAHGELETIKKERVDLGRVSLAFYPCSHLVYIHSGRAREFGRANWGLNYGPYVVLYRIGCLTTTGDASRERKARSSRCCE
jgi:hypothetical protein